jgi:GNAT superfamily N-acetyltransferase
LSTWVSLRIGPDDDCWVLPRSQKAQVFAPFNAARVAAMVRIVDRQALLALYDRQIRRDVRAPDVEEATLERHAKTVVWYGKAEDDPSGVLWSDLTDEDAEAVIAAEVGRLRQWGRPFEWKYFSHDKPTDLPRRLEAAGLRPTPEEAVMVGDIEELDLDVAPPAGVKVCRVSDKAEVKALLDVNEEASGARPEWVGRVIARSIELERPPVVGVVAWADGRPVCSARVDFHEGTEFASLWGGATLPEWRGQGIYRAVVAFRGRLARDRGHRYLQVDALPTSRPILERLGFVQLTATRPYVPVEVPARE